MGTENYINHIALVLDASSSMDGLQKQVIQVADNQIAYLAQRSKELDQETRITVYTFANTVKCLIYDKDVLRLPSLAGLYHTNGMTALLDATAKALEDLSKTPELYGDHAFLTYVLTDGGENASVKNRTVSGIISALPNHWTVAVFVPNQNGVFEAKRFGFPAQNVAVWDTNARGLSEVGAVIRETTDNFMQARASGVRDFSSGSIFQIDLSKINTKKLQEVNRYQLFDVTGKDTIQIRPFVESKGLTYKLGMGYYQLTKTEHIQAQKKIAILNKKNGTIYSGVEARKVLGLPDHEVKVPPTYNAEYEIFVQSLSVNRNLIPGQKLLVLP